MKVSFSRWLPAITPQNLDITRRALARAESARPVGRRLAGRARLLSRSAAMSANAARQAAGQRINTRTVGDAVARTDVRKGALALAGLAFVAGIAAGPGTATHAGAAPAAQPAATAVDAGTAPPAGASTVGTPGLDQLVPYGTQGAQSSTPLSSEQIDNARTIVHTARKMGLPDRAAVIGVATSLQESKLNNFGDLGGRNDHDSLGLFQQRPSSGWGTPDEVTNPEYAARAFFNGLQRVDGWQRMPLTDAAQTVQVSAYPFAYAQWERQAADIVQTVDRGH